jgi:hypothetical protein
MEVINQEKSKAELHYEKYIAYKRKYNNEHRDKVNEQSRKWFRENIMANEEKYKEYLEKRRQKYQEKKLQKNN